MIVFVEGRKYTIKEPEPRTLKKYGLDLNQWKDLLASQDYRCAICGHTPPSGIFRTDHIHVPNYKNMKPEKKRLWIRGMLCVHCNRFYVAKGITIDKARGVLNYLERFEKRRPK